MRADSPTPPLAAARGRGSGIQPPNRFERLHIASDPDIEPCPDDEPRPIRTEFLRDASRTIIVRNTSPDIPFDAGINVYRGCEHGCPYCYARPTHEYLGFSAGLDFESRIMVKTDAPALLRRELMSPRWKPEVLAMSGVTDCYQPIERKLQLTRQCLEVLADFRNPVGIITKNHLVIRDIDHLAELAAYQAVSVHLSVTTLDPHLAAKLEPRASSPTMRLDAIRQLAEAGIPVGVAVAPIIPGLNEHEIPAILEAARDAGATRAGYSIVRLPHAVKDVFAAWLDTHVPGCRDKILTRIESVRSGRLNDPRFRSRLHGEGEYADQIRQIYRTSARKLGFSSERRELSSAAFQRPGIPEQLTLI